MREQILSKHREVSFAQESIPCTNKSTVSMDARRGEKGQESALAPTWKIPPNFFSLYRGHFSPREGLFATNGPFSRCGILFATFFSCEGFFLGLPPMKISAGTHDCQVLLKRCRIKMYKTSMILLPKLSVYI